MNVFILTAFTLIFFAYFWLIQTIALYAVGEGRFCWPFRHGSDSKSVRAILKLTLGTGLLAFVVLYPAAIGQNPWQYHLEKFTPARWGEALRAALLVFGVLCVPLAVGVAAGWIKFGSRYPLPKLAVKVAKSFLIPIPLTIMEEPLFRGLVLEQFWQALPHGFWGETLAVLAAAAIFSVAHFAKEQKHIAMPASVCSRSASC